MHDVGEEKVQESLMDAKAERATRRATSVSGWLERYGILVAWLVVIIIFSILAPTTFPTIANFDTIASTQAVLLIMTLGLLLPLAAGEFDLSVGATMGFAPMVVGYLNVFHHWPIVPAVVVALLVGIAFGGLNAFLIVRLGIPSLIATLGSGTLLTGLGYGLSNSETIGGISNGLINFATWPIGGLPLSFLYAIAITVLIWYLLEHTPLGRYLFFVGEGREVARLAGLPVNRLRTISLISGAFVATIAGVLQAGTVGAADPTVGVSYLLPTFAGAFLGATAIRPGRFNAWGSLIAVYFLVTGITGLELLGFAGWVQQIFYGGVLIIAVALGRITQSRRALQ